MSWSQICKFNHICKISNCINLYDKHVGSVAPCYWHFYALYFNISYVIFFWMQCRYGYSFMTGYFTDKLCGFCFKCILVKTIWIHIPFEVEFEFSALCNFTESFLNIYTPKIFFLIFWFCQKLEINFWDQSKVQWGSIKFAK